MGKNGALRSAPALRRLGGWRGAGGAGRRREDALLAVVGRGGDREARGERWGRVSKKKNTRRPRRGVACERKRSRPTPFSPSPRKRP